MSICSYCSIEMTFPFDTEFDAHSHYASMLRVKNGQYYLYMDGESCYADYVLEDVVDLFGKPLDKVAGLHLECFYELMEDDGWRFTINIDDGKVSCQQTETRWVDCSVKELGIGSVLTRGAKQRRRDEQIFKAKAFWNELEDVLIDDDECLMEDFEVFPYRKFEKGTHREDIWHFVEETFDVSVAYLMGLCKNPDGTDE